MAGKEITMVLEVDLDCERCNKKITRVLENIKDKMNIRTIKFDKERNVVTISGPFDAEKVRRKLCREAGRVIKSMHVVVKAPEEKKDDGGMEREEDGRKAAAAAVDLRPLLKKMLEQPKPRTTPCTCCCAATVAASRPHRRRRRACPWPPRSPFGPRRPSPSSPAMATRRRPRITACRCIASRGGTHKAGSTLRGGPQRRRLQRH